MAQKRAESSAKILLWEWPTRTMVSTDIERVERGGITSYRKTVYHSIRTPLVRLIWAETQRTLIVFGCIFQIMK